MAVLVKEKENIKILKTFSFELVQSNYDPDEALSSLNFEGTDVKIEDIDRKQGINTAQVLFSDALKEINLSNSVFVPALTEPAIYYHIFEGSKQKGKGEKIAQEIINDIQETKNVTIAKDNLDYTELADKSLLSVFINGDVNCIRMINSLAVYHGKRFYKIPSVKSAEISLSYYIAKRKKFFPDDNSLIVYIGKEYSKLIFLHGRTLKHIGSTLDIGTNNLHTYDVYFSKILLEMENGGISNLDNIIVCGEDDSENLILSFYGTFPEANVSRLEFDDFDLSSLDKDAKEKLSMYAVPLSVANDYFDDVEGIHSGINLLPKHVKEEQKVFQFAWHGYALLPLLFIAALLVTVSILNNGRELNNLDKTLSEKKELIDRNQAIINNINSIQRKIDVFGQTQVILDSASSGGGVWSRVLNKLSIFFAANRGLWLTKLSKDEAGNIITLQGYTLNKNTLTDLAYYINHAELKSITFESILDKNTYKFLIVFDITNYYKDNP